MLHLFCAIGRRLMRARLTLPVWISQKKNVSGNSISNEENLEGGSKAVDKTDLRMR
jgi:hypothetical protein